MAKLNQKLETTRKHTQLSVIVAALLVANGNQEWFMSQPITVNYSHHSVSIHGLCISPSKELYVSVIGGDIPVHELWHKLTVEDTGSDEMIAAIYDYVLQGMKERRVA